MNTIQAILMGIVEGVTEFLPVSSTAHLEITQMLLGLASSEFIKSFIIIIQLGAILAIVFLYRQKLFSSFSYVKNVAIAFIPTGIIGLLLYKLIKSFFLGNIFIAALALLLGGLVILFFERRHKKENPEKREGGGIETLSAKQSFILGCAQALAVVPGVSRSGAVIVAGRLLGISKVLITEFSFLLAVPTMLAASSYDLLKSGFAFESGDWRSLGIGFVVSFVIAVFVVKWLVKFIQEHSFAIFGWYRIIIGISLLLYLSRM